MDISAVADRLTKGCRVLAEQDIIDAYGHLSARVADQPNLFVINRAMSPALVVPEDFIVMDLDGKVVEGKGFPNQEWPIHACVYRARPDVASVLHSHSTWSRVWSLSPVKFRGVLMGQAHDWNDGLPVYRDPGLIRNVERGERMAETLGGGSAMLLRGHGDVVADADVARTVMRSITLKQNAEVLHAVLAHGGAPDYWSAEDAKVWVEPMGPAVSREAAGQLAARALDYYEARIDGRLQRLLHPETEARYS
jgi:HCOMODA/2-hydroxy-3-carboxy-muconic semialdehyde decarboxylase